VSLVLHLLPQKLIDDNLPADATLHSLSWSDDRERDAYKDEDVGCRPRRLSSLESIIE
jgi:hypothetical protein